MDQNDQGTFSLNEKKKVFSPGMHQVKLGSDVIEHLDDYGFLAHVYEVICITFIYIQYACYIICSPYLLQTGLILKFF